MDVSQWLTYGGDPTLAKLAAYSATSLPWNIAHAAGNAAFALAFGPILIAAIKRARTRLEPVWLPVGSSLNGLGIAALLAVAAPFAGPPGHPTSASAAAATPLKWLLSVQNVDGGFGSDRGGSSAPMTTAWAALALAASGKRLDSTARSGGLTVMERLMADARTTDDPGAAERLLLAAVAAGGDPHGFGGSDLVAQVRGRLTGRGYVKSDSGLPAVNLTAFAIISLVGAAEDPSAGRLAAAVGWLRRQQQQDGGFGPYGKGTGGSDVDDTAAVLQALAAAGAGSGSAVDRAVAYVKSAASASGGYPMVPGQQPNSQSTAWAIQGLEAVGQATASARHWLRQQIGADGKVAYAPGSMQTPVWVTSQALLALSGHPLPLGPPPALGGQGSAGESGGQSAVSSGESTRSVSHREARKVNRDRAQAVRKGRQIEHAHAIAMAAARAAGTLIGAFVRAFSGASR
jgi:energy-coupling factor transport system substrate-specific component